MSEKALEWIPLTHWSKHFRYPTLGTMRNIAAQRKENGADAFLSMVNGRFYISVAAFEKWMAGQKQGGKK